MTKKTAIEKQENPQETEETQPVGRPTSYRPEYASHALALCQLGATDAELADYFGVAVRTIANWQSRYPEFHEALRTGKSEADDRVQRSLYQRAMGTEYEEAHPIKVKKTLYENGKKVAEEERIEVVMVKRIVPADTTAAIFWMKNRRSKEWRDVHKVEHGGAGAFDDLSDAQLSDYIISETKEMMPQLEPQPPTRGKRATKH